MPEACWPIVCIEKQMIERPIPVSGEMLPAIGIGSWIQFDVAADSPERIKLLKVLHEMKTGGARVIDTSPMYGKAEQRIGELTNATSYPDYFFFATKIWTTGYDQGVDQMESSLEKLKRKTIDLVQVHNMQDWQTHIQSVNNWKAEGRVRYSGVTHYLDNAHEQLEEIVRSRSVDFVQFNYSLLSRNAENKLLPACRDNGVAVIINEPFEKGRLFKRVKGKKIPDWARDFEISNWASFFLKYILAEPAVTCVIPGTSEPDHMKDILSSGEGPLPDDRTRKMMVEFVEGLQKRY